MAAKKQTKKKQTKKKLEVIENSNVVELAKNAVEDFPPEPEPEVKANPLPPAKPVAPTIPPPITTSIKKKRTSNPFRVIKRKNNTFY